MIRESDFPLPVSKVIFGHIDSFPSDVVLLNAPVAETHKPVGTTLREIRKIVRYKEKGDLDEKPYF